MASGAWRRAWRRHEPLLSDLANGAVYFLKCAGGIYVARRFLVELTCVGGRSMEPTFNERGDVVVMEKVSVWADRIKVGDVVVARHMLFPHQTVMKRVLGMPGDVVPLVSSYTGAVRPGHLATVPEGHVWLQGDAPLHSRDSRDYGPVPYAMLIGRAVYRIWPPLQAGRVDCSPPAWLEVERQREQYQQQQRQQQEGKR